MKKIRKMKKYYGTLLMLILFIFGMSCQPLKEKDKPNILFIFTDDQKVNTINALGNPLIHTPNMDKLTESAFLFRNAYCFGGNAGAVCIPSRNMLMSGQVFFRFEQDYIECKEKGIKRHGPMYTNNAWPSIPKSLKAAGYETFFREKSGSANNPDVRNHFDHKADIHMVNALSTGRPAEGIVDQALQFMETDRDTTKPFFMYLGFPCPHDPRWSLKEFRDLYNPEEIPLPENYKPVHEWDIGDMTIRDESLERWPRTEKAVKKHIHDYWSVISSMDYDIGRLMEGVKKLGLEENTIIVFSSDQGIALGEHGMMGKQNIYDGTMRVPFFITGPGINKGSSDALVYIHDIYPTICDLANATTPEGLDGVSLYNIIEGKQEKVRDNLMMAYRDFQRSVRDDKWKLIRFPKIGKTMLFDLENDPLEMDNLAEDPQHAELLKSMFEKLDKERLSVGDSIDLFSGDYAPAEFDAPTEKVWTPYPAGGLAPEDPSYVGPTLKEMDDKRKEMREQRNKQRELQKKK